MKKYSIIKFGSQLNSNFDKYSDKDLLIVTDNVTDLIRLYEKFTNEGWSVSGYTYSKLEYLSKKGSLFLTHLKLNSITIHDFENRFKKIIENHFPKTNYNNELIDSTKYFGIIEKIPDLQLGYAWFADCFYVGLRNYLIFKNANDNIFEFSYLKIINRLLINRIINVEEYKILKELRIAKFNYRENILDELPSRSFIVRLLSIGERLNILQNTQFSKSSDFREDILKKIYSDQFNGYQRLRLVEGIYCSKKMNIPEIKKIVSNPQFYACKLTNNTFLNNIIILLEKGKLNNFISLVSDKKLEKNHIIM
jgi:hypothetical protein